LNLPNADQAIIPPEKLRDYLLSMDNEDGRSKAIFLARLGYTRERWSILEADLRSHILSLAAEETTPSKFGRKFTIRGPLQGPSGEAVLTSIWIIRHGEEVPRFVTAYPARKS
jgi:hypothetical protein